MGRYVVRGLVLSLVLLLSNGVAHAVPSLQLDISGGTYVAGEEETIFATGSPFTLYALLKPNGNLLTDYYYISAAIVPVTEMPGGSLGSFTFNGSPIAVTSGMTYGTPPLESNAAFDPGDLSKHGIFPTYYKEFRFQFSADNKTSEYNSQDDPGGLQPWTSGAFLYYAGFTVDTSGLEEGYSIHFDLYNEKFRNGDTDVNLFAPFSHDASSTTNVPEPGALLLLGSGLIGVAIVGRMLYR